MEQKEIERRDITQSQWWNFILVEIVAFICFLFLDQAWIDLLNSIKQLLQGEIQQNTIDQIYL